MKKLNNGKNTVLSTEKAAKNGTESTPAGTGSSASRAEQKRKNPLCEGFLRIFGIVKHCVAQKRPVKIAIHAVPLKWREEVKEDAEAGNYGI